MSAFAVSTYLGKAQRRPVPTIAYLYDPLFSYIANKAANEGCQRGILLVTPVTAQCVCWALDVMDKLVISCIKT